MYSMYGGGMGSPYHLTPTHPPTRLTCTGVNVDPFDWTQGLLVAAGLSSANNSDVTNPLARTVMGTVV